MTIESHVKRLHTDSYDHLVRKESEDAPIRVGILDTHITRRVTAPSRRAVSRGPC